VLPTPAPPKKREFRISPTVAVGDAMAVAANVAVAPAGKLAIWQFDVNASGCEHEKLGPPVCDIDPLDQSRPSSCESDTSGTAELPGFVSVTENDTLPPGAT
jgi:hypothetical protein